tara:strand:+ start:390 stop:1001 length:612 start_codon:yes stop_codon:yes gene_type:complete
MLNYIYKTFFILIILFSTYFFIELYTFKEKILSIDKYESTQESNIVILTGGSNRIKDGLKIINKFNNTNNLHFKILVSGTGKGFTKLSLRNILNADFDLKLLDCCLELESVSKNTFSNATETFKWATRNNIKQFILITSNYHMPRALLEFRNKMPNIKIFTHPITPKKHDINKWLSSTKTFSLVLKEFSKFLIASFRIKLQNI